MAKRSSKEKNLSISALKASSLRPQGGRGKQRQQTRARIIDAARVQFQTKRFHFTTVDDIVSYAKISRATFYTYFRGKEEVLLEIVLSKYEPYHRKFQELVALPKITQATLSEWVIDYLEFNISEREWLLSFYVVCDLYEDMPNHFSRGRDAALEIMGRRFTIFRAPEGGELDDRMRARGHMLLYQIEQFALHASQKGWVIDIRTFANELAKAMLLLIREGDIGPVPDCE